MKGRQLSPRLQHSPTADIITYKPDPFNKSFRKKYQQPEPSTLSSSSNLIKTFSKARNRPANPTRDSPPKLAQRRSHSKGLLPRHTDKISLTSHAYHQPQMLPTSAKLLKISAIFASGPCRTAEEALLRLQHQNEEYLQLLLDWQKSQIYDEVDRLVYKLMQTLISITHSLADLAYRQFDNKLQIYETAVCKLQEENKRLRAEREMQQHKAHLMEELQLNTTDLYHKNQWSTAILHEVGRTGLDLESLVKAMPIYKYVAYGDCTDNGIDSDQDSHMHIHIPKHPQKIEANMRLTKSEVTSQSNQSHRPIPQHMEDNNSEK